MRNDRSSIGSRAEFPLKAPHIPSVGSYFDVHITMAAHPGNFTIQPLNSNQELAVNNYLIFLNDTHMIFILKTLVLI